MDLDADACYRALSTRDARFDGHFVTAVRSTGVYCRPICPARTPRRQNCLFLPCAAAAEEAGFRPCRRCRPEASPGTPAWLGTSATVSRALRLIAEGALDGGGVDALAHRLGVSERHLRRLFVAHLGASPLAVAQTRRTHFAKQLIDTTALPMTRVAAAAGFSSIRRFNAAIRAAYAASPTELRRNGAARRAEPELTLHLGYRPPLPWRALLGFLAARAIPGVEQVVNHRYRRTLCLAGCPGTLEVAALPDRDQLRVRVSVAPQGGLIQVAERVRRIFDLGADPLRVELQLRRNRVLARALDALPGVRVPGAWDGFELAVRAILGQQVSVAAATRLAGRLAATYGEPLPGAARDDLRFLFPAPEALVHADAGRLGLPEARAAAIRALATAVAKGELTLDTSRGLAESIDALRALPGIGDWTAHYIAMRALREPDAFPAGDLGLRRALGRPGRPASRRQIEVRSQAWRPWRAYAAVLLWSVGS